MKKLVGILGVAILTMGTAQNAFGLTQFKKAFEKKYTANHKSEDFQKLAKKTSCKICHVGKKKSYNNAYGTMLKKLIEGDANDRYKAAKKKGPDAGKAELEKILKELDAAFDKVAKAKVSKEKDAPTYGDLIKAGKLPVDPEKALAAHNAELKKAAKK